MATIPRSKLASVWAAMQAYLDTHLSGAYTFENGAPFSAFVGAAEGDVQSFRPPMVVIVPIFGETSPDVAGVWEITCQMQVIIPLQREDYAPIMVYDAHEVVCTVLNDYERDDTLASLIREIQLGPEFQVRPVKVEEEYGAEFWYVLEQPFSFKVHIPSLR